MATFKIIVNGYLLKIAAFPESSSVLARPGWTGFNCCLLVSNTKTLLIFDCSEEPLLSEVMVASTMLESGFALQALALTLVILFNLQP